MAYIYRADNYCDRCGEQIAARIRANGKGPKDEIDHHSFDSGEFPKLYDAWRKESDTPEHCGQCHEFLLNPLTSEGYKNVQERLNESKAVKLSGLSGVLREWAGWYEFRYWDAEDCQDDGRHSEAGWYSSEMDRAIVRGIGR
jgi:hypothetical protein